MKAPVESLRKALRKCDLDAEILHVRTHIEFSSQLESAYQEDNAEWHRKHYRRSALITLLCYNVFIAVDAIVVPDVFALSVALHLGFITPVFLLAVLLLSRPRSWRFIEMTGAMMPLCFFLQAEVVFLASRAPSADHYQYLVLFPVVFANAIIKLPFRNATAVSLLVMIGHGIVVFGFAQIAIQGAVMGIMTLVATTYMTLLSAAVQEGAYRRSWLRRRYTELLSADLSDDNRNLTRLSRIDPLTGVANRRGFDHAVASVLAAGSLEDAPFCVVMLDVDNFKSFNDTYGHAEGDRCLCIVAGVMMDCLRMENDVVARFGGEEFIAVLPDCPLEEGTLIAERIRRALAAAAVPHVRQGVSHVVTASLGVAQGRMGDMIGLHEAVSRADAALYEAKKAGRNRVEPQPSRRGQIRLVDPAEAQTIGRTA